jgi:hypothetical protein
VTSDDRPSTQVPEHAMDEDKDEVDKPSQNKELAKLVLVDSETEEDIE